MARKKQRSLLRMQQEKLRQQKAAKKGGALAKRPPTQKALPPGKKGGAIKPTRGPRRTNVTKSPSPKARVGKPGKGGVKPQLRLPPKGGTASKLLKNAKAGASLGSRGLSGVGLVLSGISTAQDLTASLKRGEGYASLPKLAKAIAKGKPKKTTGGKSNRRGRSTSKPSPKPAKRGMSNIPAKEGTGKGSPNDKPKVTAKKAPKAAPKTSAPKASAPKSSAPKKTPAKKSATSTYKAHGSDLHVGRYKTLKEHRAAVAKNKKKK
jgi:hypothetical protein